MAPQLSGIPMNYNANFPFKVPSYFGQTVLLESQRVNNSIKLKSISNVSRE